MTRTRYAIATVSLSVIGAATLALCTPWGVGLSPDSVEYVAAAHSLLRGEGLRVPSYSGEVMPLTHYPPLFPTWLASIGFVGIDPVQGARWFNIFFFAVNIAFFGQIVYSSTRSFSLPIFGSFLLMSGAPIVQVHLWTWSEPLFLFFELLGIYLLSCYLHKSNSRLLVASSTAVALGALTRYIGIAVVVTGVIGLVLYSRRAWRKRCAEVVLFCSISGLPIGLWLIRNLVVAGTTTNREIGFRPPTPQHLEVFTDTLSTWLVLPKLGWLSLAIVFALFCVLLSSAVLRRRQARTGREEPGQPRTTRHLPALLGFFVLIYSAFLILAICFLDIHILPNHRILSPVYVAALAVALCLSYSALASVSHGWTIRIPLIILLVLYSFPHLAQAMSLLVQSYRDGFGYAGRVWRQSELVRYVDSMDRRVPVYTNGPDGIYILAGRPAYMIPRKLELKTLTLNERYSDELGRMSRDLRDRKGVLVYFHEITWRWHLPTEEELGEQLELRLVVRDEDGAIYRVESGRTPAGTD